MKYQLEQAIPILDRTPDVLRTLLLGLPDEWIFQNEGGDSWSPYDVVGHLIHGEKTDWMQRIAIILRQGDEKTFTPFDRFAQFEESKGKTLYDLLDEFKRLREINMIGLRALNLTEKQLEQRGIHPELGDVTLSQLLSAWVVHDLGHINQISRVMAKQYKDQVGPWTEYLTVLFSKKNES